MANAFTQTVRVLSENGVRPVVPGAGTQRLGRPGLVPGLKGGRVLPLDTMWDYFIDDVPDPDFALAQNPDFDEMIRQQPDVHAAMTLREINVAGLPARVEATRKRKDSTGRPIDERAAQATAEYVEAILDDLPNRVDLYRMMQNAVLAGGQGVEFNWWKNPSGCVVPVEYFPVDKRRFVFDTLGNLGVLTRDYPVWGAYVSQPPNSRIGQDRVTKFPPGKFLYHKYKAVGGPWHRPAGEGYIYWGRGEQANLYYVVMFSLFALRFQMKWLERFGMPLAVLEYPENESVQGTVDQIVKSIRGEGVVTLPRPPGAEDGSVWYKLEFPSIPAEGQAAFADFQNAWVKPRVEAVLLGGSNQMEVGDVGGYAATVSQHESGPAMLYRFDARNIDETVNRQLIPAIVRSNPAFAALDPAYFPRHVMEPKEEVDQAQKVETLLNTATAVPVRETDFYEAAGVEAPDDGEGAVFLGMAPELGGGELDGDPRQGGPPKAKKGTESKGGRAGRSGVGKSGPKETAGRRKK